MRISQAFFLTSTVLASVVFTAAGCNKTEQAQEPNAPPPPGQVGERHIVLNDTFLTLTPSDVEAVPHPQAGGAIMVQNTVGHLFRGLFCTVRQVRPGWVEIKLDDDAEGWVPAANVAVARGLTEATILEPTPVFRTPMQNQAALAAVLPQGELVYVMEPGQPLTKVQAENVGVVYIDSKRLVKDDAEVGMSHLIIHTKMYARAHDYGEVSETLDEARIMYPNSSLLSVIADQVELTHFHDKPAMPTSRMGQQGY